MSKSDEIKYNWLEFAQSFLLLAKLACQELEDKRDNKYSKTTKFDPSEFNIKYQPADLFVSIIFNVKHGLEVFIKTLTIIASDKYNNKSHDIKYLFDGLKIVLPKKIKPLKDGRGDEIKQEEIDIIPKNLEELEKLVLKYYHCEFINNNKKIVNIYDSVNDIFRYPENKAEIIIDLEFVDDNLIKSIHNDIDKIYRLFNDLGYMVDVYKKNRLTEEEIRAVKKQ